jgi:hypothetical protein
MQNDYYIVVTIETDEDDRAIRDPKTIAEDIIDAEIEGVVEARCAYDNGFGHVVQYGPSYAA